MICSFETLRVFFILNVCFCIVCIKSTACEIGFLVFVTNLAQKTDSEIWKKQAGFSGK